MPSSIKNILIGIFVLAAIGIMVFILLFLHPSVGDNAKTLRVRFTDIDKVNLGTRVTYAGKAVGEVVSIEELPQARTSRTARNGDVYVYELVLKVDSGVDVFNTDSINLRTSGLLGERNVEINPQPLKPGETLKKVENEVLYAEPVTSVEDTMKELESISKKFVIVLDDFHHLMEEIEKEKIVKKISSTVDNVLEIAETLNKKEKLQSIVDNTLHLTERAKQSWTTVDSSLQNFHHLTERAGKSWDTVDLTLNEFQTSAKNAISFTEKANQIIDYTRHGKGTLGELFMGDELYLRLKSILHKGEVAMNDVNTYGLLFHLDKRWQRLQGKRIRLLERLSTPCAFAHYFNEEMDQISASLSRVSMVLNESECYPDSLIYNPDFTKRFAELLKRIENMEETLKIYNEQIIDQDTCSYQ